MARGVRKLRAERARARQFGARVGRHGETLWPRTACAQLCTSCSRASALLAAAQASASTLEDVIAASPVFFSRPSGASAPRAPARDASAGAGADAGAPPLLLPPPPLRLRRWPLSVQPAAESSLAGADAGLGGAGAAGAAGAAAGALARLPAGLPGAASASSRAAKALTAFIASARGPGSAHRARSTAHAPTRAQEEARCVVAAVPACRLFSVIAGRPWPGTSRPRGWMAHIDARPRCVAAVRSMGRKRERESGGDGGGERETRDDAQPAAQKPRRAERSIGEQTSHIKNKQRRGAIYERLKHKAAVRPRRYLACAALRTLRAARALRSARAWLLRVAFIAAGRVRVHACAARAEKADSTLRGLRRLRFSPGWQEESAREEAAGGGARLRGRPGAAAARRAQGAPRPQRSAAATLHPDALTSSCRRLRTRARRT